MSPLSTCVGGATSTTLFVWGVGVVPSHVATSSLPGGS
jgi:hypothetical protein